MTTRWPHGAPVRWGAATLALGLLLSALVAWWVGDANRKHMDEALTQRARTAAEAIVERISLYQYGLRGVRGAVLATGIDDIDRGAFLRYSETREVEREFPGALGFGVIWRVPRGQEEAFVAASRDDGWPDFTIRTLAPHDGERFVIRYIEPVARNREAVGLDIASEANRRRAAIAAIDDGAVRLTGPITLVQATGDRLQSFLILMPIYRGGVTPGSVADRRALGVGWSYAPLNMNEVLGTLELDTGLFGLTLSDITDGADEVVFSSGAGGAAGADPQLHRTLERDVFGRRWRIDLSALPAFAASLHPTSPALVFAGGALASLLAAALAATVGTGHARNREIRRTQHRLATIVENSGDAIIGQTLDGRVLSWNAAATRLFGFETADVIGRRLSELLVPPDRRYEDAAIIERIVAGTSPVTSFDTVRLHRNGSPLDVSVTASAIHDASGAVVGVATQMRDIGVRKAEERRMARFNAHLEQQVAERTAEVEAARRSLQTVVDAVPSLIGYWDHDLVCRFANRAYGDWFGCEPAELVGRPLRTLVAPDVFTLYEPRLRAALAGHPQTFETTRTHRDGSGQRHTLTHYIPDGGGEDGGVRGLYVLVHDITELGESRRRLANALRENEGLLQAIREHLLWSVTDRMGHILDINDNMCRLLGYAREELVGRTHRVINSGQHAPEFWRDMWQTIAAGRSWRGEVCNHTRDGGRRWLDSVIIPFTGEDGEIERYVALRIDITDRKAAEAERNRSNRLLRSVLESATEFSIVATDPSGVITIFNRGAERMLGYDATEVVGRHTPAIIHLPEEIATRGAELTAQYGVPVEGFRVFVHVPEIKGAEAHEWTFVRKDGLHVPVSLVATTIRDDSGTIVGYLGVAQDIGPRKAFEAGLRRATAEAEAANLAKSQFLANMSHEIRTPMNAVLGLVRLLGHSVLGSDQRDLVSKIEAAGRHLLTIINDILDVSKIEAGRLELEVARFRLPDLLDPVATMMAASALDKDLELAIDVQPDTPPELMGDGFRLQQVLVNLTGNAIKFTDRGGVTVRIGTGPGRGGEPSLLVAVEDTGSGISAEALPTLFDAFSQADTSTTRHHGGTGLGLSICKRLVELMGGSIDVETHVGRGSAFRFTIPLVLPAPARPPAAEDGGPAPAPRTVLIVAGSETIRRTTVNAALALGWTAVDVAAGADALALLRSRSAAAAPFDAVIAAHGPGDDAFALLRDAKAMAPPVPVILVCRPGHRSALQLHPDLSAFHAVLVQPVTAIALAGAMAPGPAPGAASKGTGHADRAGGTTEPTLEGVRLLVVEDNAINQEIASRILRGQGAVVEVAGNGREALDRLRGGSAVDAVLMDIQMPVMDGYEATRLIRADARLRDLPVIALSAGAMVGDRAVVDEVGMNGFIPKPFEVETLVAAIRQHVAPRPAVVANPSSPAAPTAVPVLDIDRALRLVDGDRELFAMLIGRFVEATPADLAAVRAHLVAGDGEPAARVLHALRGAAGNVAAMEVAAGARTVETAIHEGRLDDALAEMDRLDAGLATLTEAAARHAPATAASGDAVSGDTASGDAAAGRVEPPPRDAVAALLVTLDNRSMDAVDRFAALRPSLGAVAGTAAVAALARDIDGLRFAAAADRVRALLTRWPDLVD